MKRSFRRKLIFSATALSLLTTGIVGHKLFIDRPGYGLPYTARFSPEVEDRWTALGGTWEIAGGSMRNDSNDRGAKLLTGSPNWKDYVVDADVQLLGSGSAGILARVSEAEVGENSLKSYYAGLRTVDNSLDLGAYDFAYHEASGLTLPEPVHTFRWYHIRLKVEGCQVIASAWADGRPEIVTPALYDPDCFRSGSIGLRSNGTGGIWRNVTVVPAHSGANRKPLDPAGFQHPLLPTRPPQLQTAMRRGGPEPPAEGAAIVPTQPINTLIYLPRFGSPLASIRGSVVLTRPAIFVQDSTGGVEIQSDRTPSLKIGDEVEVTGEVSLDQFNPVMRKSRIRLLREAVPVSPLVATANRVASGPFDGRFVQVEAYLHTLSVENDGSLLMDLDAGPQSFHAILPLGRSRSHLQGLALESRLRLRGVSVVDPRFNKTADPFVILVRSAEDVDLVAGPPWWRPSNLIFAGLVALGLVFTFNHLYLLAKHWRLRAVADERERLAHEIHDTLAQSFAGIGFQLQAIRNSVPRGASALEGQVELAMSMARTSHEEARRSIASLHPESLGQLGLLPALRQCAERMVKNGDLTVETAGEDGGRSVPLRTKDALYLIGQEAIVNSIRHARPHKIRISLLRTRASICLAVEDDGEGFVADSDRAGFGLLGMRKRAESISATLVVRSKPGSGTRVEVKAAVGSRYFLGPWLPLRFSPKDV